MDRRDFLKSNLSITMAMAGYTYFPDYLNGNTERSYIDYVRKSTLTKKEIDVFLKENSWAQFDPDVGYILGNYMPRDGIDGSFTISTVMNDRKRRNQVYADRPCRINTYGNSFTQCHQVSDGETWQEYLAAHLGEPIRNFGMGGFGVYQAYRRILREEQGKNAADHIILYMWGDDYFRSLLRCRYVLFYPRWDNVDGYMFHGNFWSNIEMDLTSGKLVEKENLLNTRDSLYKMTDPDFMVEALRDDLMLQLSLLREASVNTDINENGLKTLAEIYGMPSIDFSDEQKMKQSADRLRNIYAFDATKYILNKTREFTAKKNKKLMIIHFCPYTVFKSLLKNGSRYDQEIVDYLHENDFFYFDMNEVHVKDFRDYNLSLEDYMKRYFIGHYNPSGNHFFAFAIKDEIVNWLEPKPITYREDDTKWIDFKGYLPD